jgi:isochorismate hydrolase
MVPSLARDFFFKNLYLQIFSVPQRRGDDMELPNPGMMVDARRTALVITDLQNDFLSPGGIAWGLVAESLAANNTIENIESLLRAARRRGLPVFLSPHY